MTKAQVRSRENATLTEATDNDLYYTLVTPDATLAVHYRFVKNRLIEITRVPGEQYVSRQDALLAVKTLVGNYTQQYGTANELNLPERVEFRWQTPTSTLFVIVWYIHDANCWAWTNISQKTAVEPPYPIVTDDGADRG